MSSLGQKINLKNHFMIILLLLLISPLQAKKVNLQQNFYNQIYLGERPDPTYAGPLDALYRWDKPGVEISWADDNFDATILNSINPSFFKLKQFLKNDLPAGLYCPNKDLSPSLDYIRYVYRLLAISYYYEAIKSINIFLARSKSNYSCSVAYQNIFAKCSATSVDMQLFLKRAENLLVSSKEKIALKAASSINDVSAWSKQDKLKSGIISILSEFNQKSEVLLGLQQNCELFKKNILNLCSEKDDYYGISSQMKVTEILVNSNVANIINQAGESNACLPQYVNITKYKEYVDREFNVIFDAIYRQLLVDKTVYIEGELFLAGALKEFDDLGLNDFLFAKKTSRPATNIIKAKKTPVNLVWRPSEYPAPVKKNKQKIVIKGVVKVPKKKKVTAFMKAVGVQKKYNSSKALVNMQEMKKDFIFTDSMKKILENSLYDFQSQKILKEMKTYDQFGSKNAPMRLIFLKFMIDFKKHQGLYNVINILGSNFYVINDIEKKKDATFILLEFDKKKSRWQISITRPPTDKDITK